MKELPENQDELNQTCLQSLKDLKVPIEHHYLYCVQLASWAAENGKLDVGYQAKETLAQMYGWKPEEVMYYLENMNPDDPEEKTSLVESEQQPIDMAWAILDMIEDRLVTSIGYDKMKKA